MTSTQGQLADLSRFIFKTPRWYRSLAFAILLAGLTGIAVFDAKATMDARFGFMLVGQDAWQGIFFIGIPTVVAVFATTAIDRAMGGHLTYNRSSLLALVCEVIVVVFLVGAAIVTVAFGLDQRFVFDALVVALASIFAFRLLVVVAVSRLSLARACIPASVQSVVAALLVFVYSGTVQFLTEGGSAYEAYVAWLARGDAGPPAFEAVTPDHFLLLVAVSAVYAVAVWAFLVGIDRPWRRSLGVSVLDFIRGFIGHVAEGSRELEAFFEAMGQEAVVPVSVVSFRHIPTDTVDEQGGGEDGDDEDDDKNADHLGPDETTERPTDSAPAAPEKARFVVPMVHPGPMGDIGGGNLPMRIARRAEGLAFSPHATAGHDFNLVSERQVDRVLDAADRALAEASFGREATVPVRESAGAATTLAQGFGDDAVAVNTFAPASADDVDFAVGQSAIAELRRAGLDDVLLADAHNCHVGFDEREGADLGHVNPGSQRSYDLYDACGLAGEALAGADRGDLELGIAHDPTEWTPREGIGPLGIRVAVTRVAGREAAYVLIDGNNMVPGLRESLLEAVTDVTGITDAEVMTSDTHAVNITRADNRVGEELGTDALTEVVTRLAREAQADLDPVTAGAATERATVTVFGNDRTETMATQANAALSLGGALLAAIVLLAMAVSLLLFFLT